MCSDVNLDQFKSEMLTQFESIKTQIEVLKESVNQCKIKPQYLIEELRNQKGSDFSMKLTNSDCEQSHYTAPARTHSMNKWTKILILAIMYHF